MATGAGKTYTAVTESYRLLKYGGFNRILFLVDRNNLADQTLAEFQNYRTPDDGRRFTELYNVTKLSSAGLLGSSKIAVSTIQRVYKFLNDGEVSEVDDPNLDDFTPDAPVTVSYSQALPRKPLIWSSSTRPTEVSTGFGAASLSISTPTSSD